MSYAEIDIAPIIPSVEVHQPRVFTPDSCVAKCSHLSKRLGEASTMAIRHPEKQFDVLCGKKALFGCNAEVIEAGTFTESSVPQFSPNMSPIQRETYWDGPILDPAQKVQEAIKAHVPQQSLESIQF